MDRPPRATSGRPSTTLALTRYGRPEAQALRIQLGERSAAAHRARRGTRPCLDERERGGAAGRAPLHRALRDGGPAGGCRGTARCRAEALPDAEGGSGAGGRRARLEGGGGPLSARRARGG